MNKKPTDNRKDILSELDSLRGLLGDEANDVDIDAIPLLGDSEASSEEQLPLLQPEEDNLPTLTPTATLTPTPTTTPTTAKQAASAAIDKKAPPKFKEALSSRTNPFLKNAEDAIASRKAAEAASKAQKEGTAKSSTALTETQISHLVDKVIEECLPHIEQTLRIHLTAALHRQNRNI